VNYFPSPEQKEKREDKAPLCTSFAWFGRRNRIGYFLGFPARIKRIKKAYMPFTRIGKKCHSTSQKCAWKGKEFLLLEICTAMGFGWVILNWVKTLLDTGASIQSLFSSMFGHGRADRKFRARMICKKAKGFFLLGWIKVSPDGNLKNDGKWFFGKQISYWNRLSKQRFLGSKNLI